MALHYGHDDHEGKFVFTKIFCVVCGNKTPHRRTRGQTMAQWTCAHVFTAKPAST